MFGHIDTVLIRWRDGFVAVPETAGGRERYVEVRGITNRDDALALEGSANRLDVSTVARKHFNLPDVTTSPVCPHGNENGLQG